MSGIEYLCAALETFTESCDRRFQALQHKLYDECELQQHAQLTTAFLEEKGAFVDCNATLVINSLKRDISRSRHFTELQKLVPDDKKKRASPVDSPKSETSNDKNEAQILSKREEQLNRLTVQLRDTNEAILQHQVDVGNLADTFFRCRARYNELLVEYMRELRIARELEHRIWRHECLLAWRKAEAPDLNIDVIAGENDTMSEYGKDGSNCDQDVGNDGSERVSNNSNRRMVSNKDQWCSLMQAFGMDIECLLRKLSVEGSQ